MPERSSEESNITSRNHLRSCYRGLLLVVCVLALPGCGEGSSDPAAESNADGDREHFLSEQQEALERSKAVAEAMEAAAAERASQTEDARSN